MNEQPANPSGLRAPQSRRYRPFLLALSVAIVVGGLGFLLADSAGFEYYKHVDEVTQDPGRWHDKRLQLHGFVVPGSIGKRFDRDHGKLEYKFRVENCGAVAEARFAGVVPDTFKEGAEVVLKGKFEGEQFHTSEVMAKCPSKYAQAGAAQSAMITRCSRDSAGAKGN
jgi:cytochrome c-type biogenesis protein CcmE